jgi:hypothetical protein
MRKLVMLATIAVFASMGGAKVWTTIYRCDGVTPLPPVDANRPTTYGDIMVGTRLVIVISSDLGEYWFGGLHIPQDDANYGTLSGRGYVKLPVNYKDSCLPSAGKTALARPFHDEEDFGFDFTTSPSGPVQPGDWFVVDYYAKQVGVCHVGLYNLFTSYDVPIETLSFTHVPSRDLNGDTIVDFKDLALLGSHWNCEPDSNSSAAAFDLNGDGRIDFADLALLAEHWLERTDCGNPSP